MYKKFLDVFAYSKDYIAKYATGEKNKTFIFFKRLQRKKIVTDQPIDPKTGTQKTISRNTLSLTKIEKSR